MIQVVAGFDIDPAKYKKKYPIPVYPMEKLEEVVKELEPPVLCEPTTIPPTPWVPNNPIRTV